MAVELKKIYIENFKSYDKPIWIDVSNLNLFMGANSSGKSTALQTLLVAKQTMECNSPEIDLLLSGKYVTLGDFSDVINKEDRNSIQLGFAVEYPSELNAGVDMTEVIWSFENHLENKNTILRKMMFCIDGTKIELCKFSDQKYRVVINEKSKRYLVEIRNLQMGNIFVEYDISLNNLFQQFLNELLTAFLNTKKIRQIRKNTLVAVEGIDEFCWSLLRDAGVTNKNQMDLEMKEFMKDEISKLIGQFAEEQLENFDMEVISYRQSALDFGLSYITEENYKRVKDILSHYQGELQQYKAKSAKAKEYQYYKIELRVLRRGNGVKGNKTADVDQLSSALMIYQSAVKDVFEQIFYVGPIREKPQGLYNIGFESIPKYVGTTGAYFASVLLRENKKKEYLFPNNEKEEVKLGEALDEWTHHLNIANEINVEQKNSFGFSVLVENTQNRKSDIMNVGIGTSQVLPVLISGLLSEKGETLIFEQPELHLHPFSQSRLVDFFVALALNGRKIYVETHSEYMILRLRYHVLMGHISESAVSINFFQNKNGTKVEKGILNSYGNLEYPEDFKDETQELLNHLIEAAITKGKNNDKKCSN